VCVASEQSLTIVGNVSLCGHHLQLGLAPDIIRS